MDLITIIVPIYNAEQTLHRCITSILNQTYKKWELILVNDGSTDGSGGICNFFCGKDRRIKVIEKENGGASSARNAGLLEAKGIYIGFVDADDYIADNFLEVLYKFAVKENCDISFCDYYEEKDGYRKEYKSRSGNDDTLSQKEFVYEMAAGRIQGFLWNKLLKREILYDQNGKLILLSETISICEDLLYCMQIVWNAGRIGYAASPLYYYCQRDDSAYRSPYNRKKLTEILAYDSAHEILLSKMPEVLPLLEKKYLNMALKLQDLFVHSGKGGGKTRMTETSFNAPYKSMKQLS